MVEEQENIQVDYLRVLRQHFRRSILIGGQEKKEDGGLGVKAVDCLTKLRSSGIQKVQTGPVFSTVKLYCGRWMVVYTSELMHN